MGLVSLPREFCKNSSQKGESPLVPTTPPFGFVGILSNMSGILAGILSTYNTTFWNRKHLKQHAGNFRLHTAPPSGIVSILSNMPGIFSGILSTSVELIEARLKKPTASGRLRRDYQVSVAPISRMYVAWPHVWLFSHIAQFRMFCCHCLLLFCT